MPEILTIVLLALVALLIIGPRRLPESIESIWLALTDFRRVQSGQQPLGSLHNARRFWVSQKSSIYAGIQILYQVTVHLEELRRRILYILIAFGIGFGLAFAFAQPLLGLIIRPIRIIAPTVVTNIPLNNYIVLQDVQFTTTIVTATGPISSTVTIPTGTILPIGLTNTTPIVSKPTELFSTYIKIGLLVGFATALPMIMWQVLLFLRGPRYSVATISKKEWEAMRETLSPEDRAEMEKQRHDIYEGLTADETRPMFFMLPLAFLLFAGGVLFTYFLLLPSALDFLFGLGGEYVQPLPSLEDYMDFALSMVFWIGLTFELPLIMFFLARFRIVSARRFAQQWRIAVVVIVVIAAVITPTVDPLNMALVALPMIGLYLLGIGFAWLARPRASSKTLVQTTTPSA